MLLDFEFAINIDSQKKKKKKKFLTIEFQLS